MKFVYFCLILTFISRADTDILTSSDGPVVGWTDSGNVFLMKPASPADPVEIGQGYSLNLSFCEGCDTDPIILAALKTGSGNPSVVLNSISTSDLGIIIAQEIDCEDFITPIYCSILALPELPRYISSSEQRMALIDLYTCYTDVQDHRFITICSVDPWSSSIINTADTTNWIETVYLHSSYYTSLLAGGSYMPFILQTGRYYPEMGPFQYNINTIFLDGDSLAIYNLYNASGGPFNPVPSTLTSGICSSGQIGLWYDENGTLWSADFAGAPESPDLSEITLAHDDFPFPAAMTSSMDDDGILLAWYSGNEIVVRHWQNGWNSYSHIVESCGAVTPYNISVCSDTDGYWVAWLEEGRSIPEVRFIPRETVTGISEEESSSDVSGISLAVSPNPVLDQAVVSFAIPEVSEYYLYLFDVTGRNVQSITLGQGNEFSGTFSFKHLPNGVYILKLETPQYESSKLLLVTTY